MFKKKFLLVVAATFVTAVSSQPLTIANFGGAAGKAQEIAFIRPFSELKKLEARGVEYPGDLPAVRATLKKPKIEWDVVEVESTDIKTGCDEGLFERIDRASISNASILLPGAMHECGVGAFLWSTVLAYDSSRFKETPRSWQDFWDVQRFPGKRGLRKGPRYNMEFALLADGVNRREVYTMLATEAGQNRALAKLEALKQHIVWWDAGAQPPQRLASGQTTMSTAYNGRIAAANRDSSTKLTISWSDAMYELDYWAIVKGSPKHDLALAFINFATSEEPQLAYSQEIPYGPTNFNAILRYDTGRTRTFDSAHLTDLSMAPSDLPSAPGNLRRSLPFSSVFWKQYGASLEKRFTERMY